uniref:Ribosomal protein L29 n=1 Tax=Dasyclonium flaccidum TaxID=2007274 RepID=A0A1Z1MKS1_9FLOR|nr:ribosomal protein L29 [Dasyclonium flaccidum]ARW66673.1 ribosomal protein L29 [Dasyclonium flaccidum]
MILQQNENLSLEQIEEKIIRLKKELVLLNIKKTTKQKISPNIIRKTKHEISKMLRLEQSKIHNK